MQYLQIHSSRNQKIFNGTAHNKTTRRQTINTLTWNVWNTETPSEILGLISPSFFYIIEQGESTKEVSRRLHYRQTSTVSHSSPVGKTPGGPSTPIIPLRSLSLCVSLGIYVEVDLYGVNPTTSERRVFVMSTLPFISLPSFSQLRVLTFPAFYNPLAATFVSYLGFSVTAVMRVPSGLPTFLKLFLRRSHLM